jgi:hypothetical protein
MIPYFFESPEFILCQNPAPFQIHPTIIHDCNNKCRVWKVLIAQMQDKTFTYNFVRDKIVVFGKAGIAKSEFNWVKIHFLNNNSLFYPN